MRPGGRGSENWYEEDCAWACVALAFPDRFPAEAQEHARNTLAFILETDTYKAIVG